MDMSERIEIAVSDVIVKDGRRALQEDAVTHLMGSIKEIGLLHPIVVNKSGGQYILIAGRHRLEAYWRLGRKTIPATVASVKALTAQLAEIDENLVGAVSTPLEIAQWTAERQDLYEQLHPETKKGASQAVGANRAMRRGNVTADSAATSQASFAADTAKATGKSERTIRQNASIARRIPTDVQERIKGTPLASKKTELLELASLEPDEQRDAVEKIAAGAAATVLDAVRGELPAVAKSTVPGGWTPSPALVGIRVAGHRALALTGFDGSLLSTSPDPADHVLKNDLSVHLGGWVRGLDAGDAPQSQTRPLPKREIPEVFR